MPYGVELRSRATRAHQQAVFLTIGVHSKGEHVLRMSAMESEDPSYPSNLATTAQISSGRQDAAAQFIAPLLGDTPEASEGSETTCDVRQSFSC